MNLAHVGKDRVTAGERGGAAMTTFTQQELVDGLVTDDDAQAQERPKRPSRWSLKNWPVRWKVFAIVLVPLILAGAFGGLRIYSNATDARDLQRAADQAEMVPAVVSYMNALNGAMLASADGGDVAAAIAAFDSSRAELRVGSTTLPMFHRTSRRASPACSRAGRLR